MDTHVSKTILDTLAVQTKGHDFLLSGVLIQQFILTRAIGLFLFLSCLLRRLMKINTDSS